MGTSIVIDKKAFIATVDKFGRAYGIGVYDVLRDVHRSWTQNLYKFTPPTKQAIGRKRISEDINKAFIAIDKQQVLDFYAANFGNGSKGLGKKVRKSVKNLEGQGVIFNWNGDMSRIRAFHQANRKGSKKGVRFKSRDVTVGKFTFGTGMYTKRSKINAYIREKQKDVGKLKSGWITAAKKFGARIDAWVNRHSAFGGSNGFASENFDKSTGSGEFISENSVSYIAPHKTTITAWADKIARIDIQKNLKFRIEKMAKKWSTSPNG